jgi:hypothetical protein
MLIAKLAVKNRFEDTDVCCGSERNDTWLDCEHSNEHSVYVQGGQLRSGMALKEFPLPCSTAMRVECRMNTLRIEQPFLIHVLGFNWLSSLKF